MEKEKLWAQEQQRVDWVTALLKDAIMRLSADASDVRGDVVELRKYFWEDVTINFSNAEDVTETYFSMKQQADVLSERERSHRHASQTLKRYGRLAESPYFGRIDLVSNGGQEAGEGTETDKETIYLGIGSFLDPESDQFLIYDWRAPISSLYYDYGPGPVAYETPAGRQHGEMLLKRQFVIRRGQIELLFDTGLTIGDELLQQALSRGADSHMRSIVATIQKEQNLVIRNDRSRMLIVQGAAGSGKTSAALQRVAYLLYKHRQTLKAEQMVLFSPNPLFSSYVASVLPELGEDNIEQSTYQDYVAARLGGRFKLEDAFEQLEYTMTCRHEPDYGVRMAGIAYKTSTAFLNVLTAYADGLSEQGMAFLTLKFRGEPVVTARQMRSKFYGDLAHARVPNRVQLLQEWLLEQLNALEKEHYRAEWVEEELELLTPEAYQRAYQQLRRTHKGAAGFDDYEQEKELLAKALVRERLRPLRKRIKALQFVDVSRLYRMVFAGGITSERGNGEETSGAGVGAEAEAGAGAGAGVGVGVGGKAGAGLPEEWRAICALTLARLDKGELAYEDATPYLYLQDYVLGFQTNPAIRYVFIDEAQDYSPFQLAFLKRLFPGCRMTALGDGNQAIHAHTSALAELEPLVALYGEEQTERVVLTRSYRSTAELVRFTRALVAGGESITPFERPGDKPLLVKVEAAAAQHQAIREQVRLLQAEGYGSIAIIGKTAAECEVLYKLLHTELPMQWVRKESAGFDGGVQLLPVYLAKGVEFDAVVVPDVSAACYGQETERKLFYTACTRAMHALCLICPGALTPLLEGVAEDLYEQKHL